MSDVLDKFDFKQVIQMERLKRIIVNDEYYSKMFFLVDENNCNEEWLHKLCGVTKKTYRFGNEKYNKYVDCMEIAIFDDCVKVHYVKSANGTYKIPLDRKKQYTLEEKILFALSSWKKRELD